MQDIDPSRATKLFQKAFSDEKTPYYRAELIHLQSQTSLEEAQNTITSLENSSKGYETVYIYLVTWGKLSHPAAKTCIETFKKWNVTGQDQMMNFAKACWYFDIDYFFELLEKLNLEKGISALLTVPKGVVDETIIETFVARLDSEIEKTPQNLSFHLLKFSITTIMWKRNRRRSLY